MKDLSSDLFQLLNDAIAGNASFSGGDFSSADFSSSDFSIANFTGPAQPVDFDCYTITLASGTVLRFTTADFDISDGTNLWRSDLVRVDEAQSKVLESWKEGLDSDTWVVVFMPRLVDLVTGASFPDKVNGVPWLQAAQGGVFDAADFQVDRAYFSSIPTWPMPPGGAVPVGFARAIFAGVVGAVDTNAAMAVFTVNDYLSLLDTPTPKDIFSAGCRFTLFDSRCALAAAPFKRTGSAIGGTTSGSIQNGLAALPAGLTFVQGRVLMTSGLNAGFARTVTGWNGSGQPLTLMAPFPFTIVPGDTFDVYPGCAKTQAACAAFGNSPNFGGEPYVPAPEAAV